ncbi:unnamed protein product [Gordionus sp. m RMFG-2023]
MAHTSQPISVYVLKIKVAFAMAIINRKPCHMSVREYIEILKRDLLSHRSTLGDKLRELEIAHANLQMQNITNNLNDKWMDAFNLRILEDFSFNKMDDAVTADDVSRQKLVNYKNNSSSTLKDSFSMQIIKISSSFEYLNNGIELDTKMLDSLWNNIQLAWELIKHDLEKEKIAKNTENQNSKIGNRSNFWLLNIVKIIDIHSRSTPIIKNESLKTPLIDLSVKQKSPIRDPILYGQMRSLKIKMIEYLIESLYNSPEQNNEKQVLRSRIIIYLSRFDGNETMYDLDVTIISLTKLLDTCVKSCQKIRFCKNAYLKSKYSIVPTSETTANKNGCNVANTFNHFPAVNLLDNLFYIFSSIQFILMTFLYDIPSTNILLKPYSYLNLFVSADLLMNQSTDIVKFNARHFENESEIIWKFKMILEDYIAILEHDCLADLSNNYYFIQFGLMRICELIRSIIY